MKNQKGIGLVLLILIIVLILVIGSVAIFAILKKDNNNNNNNSLEKTANENTSEKANGVFFSDNYSLIYDVSNYSDSYWNSKNELYSAMTNKEYFFNKYMAQVLNQSSSNYGGGLAMPLNPNYTMYYRIYEGGGDQETCEYYLKVDFNKENIFYPNMAVGTLNGTSDSQFTFSVLDSNMNFNTISGNFNHYKKTTKMQSENNNNYKLLYEDNEWAFFEGSGNDEKTIIYADYYIDLAKYDFINFKITLNGKLKNDSAVNELMNKFKNNIQISKIEDSSTIDYIESLRPSAHYLKLNSQNEKIKVSENFTLNMQNTPIRLWGSSNSSILGTSSTSTKNVNMLQWYDKNWKNGLDCIKLFEYPNGSNYGIDNVAHAYFGSDVEIKDYTYNNMTIKTIYDTDASSYRVAKGYSNFIGLAFEINNNIYTIESTEYLKETEISSYIKYLFDNIILINK